MYQALLQDASFFSLLFQFDQDLADQTRSAGCPWCGGALHASNYFRQPRGGPKGLAGDFALRLSFCCAGESCRKRRTPPSVRFLGRRVYLAPVVVLVTAMCHGVTRQREAKLRALFGVSRRTLERWRRWWQETFPQTRFWRGAQGRLCPPVERETLPHSLLSRFRDRKKSTRVVRLLAFLGPLTTSRS